MLSGVVFLSAGCVTGAKRKAPEIHATSPAGDFHQTGDAIAPAKVNTARTDATIDIPQGSTVETKADGSSVVTVSRDTSAKLASVAGSWVGPTAEKGPTPAELARGSGVVAFYYAAAGCALLALLMGYRQHYKAAAMCAGAAIAMPIIANVVSSNVAIIVGAVLIAAGIALFAAWHFMQWERKKAGTFPRDDK